MCQMRLNQLGYNGIAFCHTVYGRLNVDKDDADVALPWDTIVSPTPQPLLSAAAKKEPSFGRKNSLGMTVYRRLNIIIEEVSDVSRILLPSNESTPSTSVPVSKILQKYDIISLQPMNEPSLQNMCELIASSSPSDVTGSSPTLNNSHYIDILVLEYATGSRGGHGLPYKLRKDYVVKVIRAGLTFELCYATAVLDPKRRQGFLRTLTDFQFSFGSIQKKHSLLNKSNNDKYKRRRVDDVPILFSSGHRQNFTQGTNEGPLAFRTPSDVNCLIDHMGGGLRRSSHDTELHHGREKVRKHNVVFSATERMVSRASDRALGVVVTPRYRSCVIGISEADNTATDHIEGGKEKEESDDSFCSQDAASSLVQWLSEPLHREDDVKETTAGEKHASNMSNSETSVIPAIKTKESSVNADDSANEPSGGTISSEYEEPNEDADDLEDGFIGL